MAATQPVKARFDRRVLNATLRAEVFRYEALWEVRTGTRRIGPMARREADTSAYVHNAIHGHGHSADGQMVDEREATS